MHTEYEPSQLWKAITSRLKLPASASINDVHKHIGSDVGRTTLGRIKRGEGSNHGSTLKRVADALKCEPGDLLPKSTYAMPVAAENTGIYADRLVSERDTVPDLKWESLVSRLKNLPDHFWTTLPDDALGSKAPRGTRAKFSTRRAHAFGDVVLLLHPGGQLHVRVLQQSIRHGWEGVALHPHYQPIPGDLPGVKVVAVFSGIDAPWAQLFAGS